ncbi:MAG: hypothetical protein IJQ53_05775 [Clostridia bacterium]|nr:hypothetical protein [Clostridia bacterium]
MKKLLVITLAALMLLALGACGKKELTPQEKAAGTYDLVHCKFVGDTEWQTDEGAKLVLNADGTGTSTRDGATYKMTWTIDGEKFTMKETFMGISIDYTGTLKDGELHTYNDEPTDDLTYEYVYAKEAAASSTQG